MTPIVIIHGWSDNSSSFTKLAKRLKKETGRMVEEIWLADYVSLDDDVTMKDIVTAMQSAWKSSSLPTKSNSVDVIVHSTGGLVIRDWMSTYWPDGKKPPVRNLLMLAPANFGSPLAHKGRSIMGRVVKGWSSDKTFQTGEHILKALEMASPYSWQLAQRDRFSPGAFNQGGVRCTVIVGNSGYSGISSLANEDGSDGTVYVATANMNCAGINLNVARDTGDITATSIKLSSGKTAFLILDGFDHGTITGNDSLPKKLLEPILQALNITKTGFSAWCRQCEAKCEKVRIKYSKSKDPEYHAFQNTVFHVVDDSGIPITDFVLEFYGQFTDLKDKWAKLFNKHIAKKKHAYGDDKSYRSFMIDTTSLNQLIDKVSESLMFSLSALPDVTNDNNMVGYKSFGENDIKQLELKQSDLKKYFSPDRTLFITIILPRYQKDALFELKNLQ